MLVIRKAQFTALGAARLSSFEDKMVAHLQKVYVDWATSLGPEKLREFVRHGMSRACSYGFQIELDIARYLHVMHDLGPHFDESTECPWAPELLTRDMPASKKMDRLRDAAEYHMEARRIGRAR